VTPVAGAARVVELQREDSVVDANDPDTGATTPAVNPDAMAPMLADLLSALTGGAARPWSALLPDYSPAMRIGIKVNCLNPQLTTTIPLVKALVASLRAELDVDPQRILVWDRRLDELAPPPPRAGFRADDIGAQVIGTVNSTTDGGGPGYADAVCGVVAGRAPHFSRILTELTDVTINLPVLKTHDVSGVTGAMKNIYGIIDNPGDYHTNLVIALPALYRLPPIRSHIRLHVIDALFAVIGGGTSSPPDAVPRRLLASTDPVAIDAYALALVNRLRAARTPNPLPLVDATRTTWLDNAHALGLGTLAADAVVIDGAATGS
jgi:hypothetical protein